jgi:hypothetical protein
MSIDVFALGGLLISLPGDVFPYNLPVDPDWYWTTLASNTLVVDQTSQIWGSTYNKDTEQPPYANQVVYAYGDTLALQRVQSTTLYSGVTEDRAVFVTPSYVADSFAGLSSTEHTYDLPWHPIGTLSTSVALTARSTADFNDAGYDQLTDVMHAFVDGGWTATITMPTGGVATLLAAANPGTEVITADGDLYVYGDNNQINPPVLIERQSGVNNAVFTNALDLSGGTYLTGLYQEGVRNDGGSSGLFIYPVHGAVADQCFVAYGSGSFSSSDGTFHTDALQALVTRDDRGALSGMFLGGGTALSTPDGTLTRADSATPGAAGLAYVERVADGGWVVGNPSSSSATVQVSLPCEGVTTSVTLGADSVQPL